jgi:hypothetical protein
MAGVTRYGFASLRSGDMRVMGLIDHGPGVVVIADMRSRQDALRLCHLLEGASGILPSADASWASDHRHPKRARPFDGVLGTAFCGGQCRVIFKLERNEFTITQMPTRDAAERVVSLLSRASAILLY